MKKFTRVLASVATAVTVAVSASPIAGAVTNGWTPSTDSIADSVVKIGVRGTNCSGVMISPSWAMTAAHCVDGVPQPGSVEVLAPIQPGINRDQGTYTATVHRHPEPQPDIVLLNLDGVHHGTYAALPDRGPRVGDVGSLVGFGGSGQNIRTAQGLDILVYDTYQRNRDTYTGQMSSATPYNGEPRQGDSGGPVFIDDQVHGIFAHGILNTSEYSEEDLVFAEVGSFSVAHYLDWIEETTGIDTVGTETAIQNTPPSTSTIGWTPQRPKAGYVNPVVTDNGPSTGGISKISSDIISSSMMLSS